MHAEAVAGTVTTALTKALSWVATAVSPTTDRAGETAAVLKAKGARAAAEVAAATATEAAAAAELAAGWAAEAKQAAEVAEAEAVAAEKDAAAEKATEERAAAEKAAAAKGAGSRAAAEKAAAEKAAATLAATLADAEKAAAEGRGPALPPPLPGGPPMTEIMRAPSLGDTPPPVRPPSLSALGGGGGGGGGGGMPVAIPARPPAPEAATKPAADAAVAVADVAVSVAPAAAPAPSSPTTAGPRRGSVALHKEVHKAAVEALEVMHKLPAGWHMTKDEASGRKYYYNLATGATSWEAPKPPEGLTSPTTPKAAGANAALLVSVDAWLSDIGHEALQPVFAENGIELLADLRALDQGDLEIFGFEEATAAALWRHLEELPQADEMVIETSGYMNIGASDASEGREQSPMSVAPAQKRAALLADITGGGGGLSAGLKHVSFKARQPKADPHASMLADIKGGRPKLKSVPSQQRGTAGKGLVADPALQGLAGVLASALTARRQVLDDDDDDDDSDGWDD